MSHNNSRQSRRVSLAMPVLCRHIAGTAQAVVQDISREGLFIRVREYIHPCDIDSVELTLPEEPEPLELTVSVRFIGRAPTGYGIGACITEPAEHKRQRWERLYQQASKGEISAIGEANGERVIVTPRAITPAVQAQLQAQGFTLVHAASNRDVFSLLRPGAAEVVLCDLHDHQLSGIALCKRLRRLPAFANVAVILVTDAKAAGDFLAGMNAGAAYVISKPYTAEYCASRVIAAARQAGSALEPGRGTDGAPAPLYSGVAFEAEFQYLHAPSILPNYVVRTIDRISDVLFLTRLAARDRLRKYKDMFAG